MQSITSRQVEVSLRETCASEHPGNTWLSASPLPCPYSVSQRHHLLPSATLTELTAHSRSPFHGTFLIEMVASELLVWRGLWVQVYRTATPQERALWVPQGESCLCDVQPAEPPEWALGTKPAYVERHRARLTPPVNHILASGLKRSTETIEPLLPQYEECQRGSSHLLATCFPSLLPLKTWCTWHAFHFFCWLNEVAHDYKLSWWFFWKICLICADKLINSWYLYLHQDFFHSCASYCHSREPWKGKGKRTTGTYIWDAKNMVWGEV